MIKPIYVIVAGTKTATVSDFSAEGENIFPTDNTKLQKQISYNLANKTVIFLTLESLKNYLEKQGQKEAKRILTPNASALENQTQNFKNMDYQQMSVVKSQDLGIVTAKTPTGKLTAQRIETTKGTGVTSTYEITIDTTASLATNTFLLGDGMGLIAAKLALGATDATISGTFGNLSIATIKNFGQSAPMATRQYQLTTNDATGAIYQTPFFKYCEIDGQNVLTERPINVQRGRNGSELDKTVRWMPELNFTAGKMNALKLVIPAGQIFSLSFEIHSYEMGTIQGLFLTE